MQDFRSESEPPRPFDRVSLRDHSPAGRSQSPGVRFIPPRRSQPPFDSYHHPTVRGVESQGGSHRGPRSHIEEDLGIPSAPHRGKPSLSRHSKRGDDLDEALDDSSDQFLSRNIHVSRTRPRGSPELSLPLPELTISRYLKDLERRIAKRRHRHERDDRDDRDGPIGGAIDASEDSVHQAPYHFPSSDDEWVPSRDEIPANLVYDFSPSCPGFPRDSDNSDMESPRSDAGGSGMATSPLPASTPAKYLGIYDSNYTGDACLWGNHSVSLTTVRGAKRRYAPQFRWLHLDSGTFDEFSREVLQLEFLSSVEKSAMTSLFTMVRKRLLTVHEIFTGASVPYLESGYIPHTFKSEDGDFVNQKPGDSRCVSWLSLPYFSLEKYAGRRGELDPSSFPIQTLLQAQFSRNTHKRDTLQGVCMVNKNQDLMFHVSQIWFIVLDDTLLITCGLPEDRLRDDDIHVVEKPPSQVVSSLSDAKILVGYTENVAWAITLDKCRSWFEFILLFREFWPQNLEFSYQGQRVVPNLWPRIWNLAKKSTKPVRLLMKIGPPLSLGPRGTLPRMGRSSALSHKVENLDVPKNTTKGHLHLKRQEKIDELSRTPATFSLFDFTQTPSTPESASLLSSLLGEMDTYLSTEISQSEKSSYERCKKSNREEIYQVLEAESQRRDVDDIGVNRFRSEFEDRVDLFQAADALYSFFFPPKAIGTITGKFWGAIRSLVQERTGPSNDYLKLIPVNNRSVHSQHYVFATRLQRIAKVTSAFNSVFMHSPSEVRKTISVPPSLPKAWLHLVMSAVCASSFNMTWEDHMAVAEALIRSGTLEIIQGVSNESLFRSIIIQPMDLVLLVSRQLVVDVLPKEHGGKSQRRVSSTYSDYLRAMENNITEKVSDRSHQHRINLLRQELAVIQNTITTQQELLREMTLRHHSFIPRVPQHQRLGPEPRLLRNTSRETRSKARNYYSGPDVAGTAMMQMQPYDRIASTDGGGIREMLYTECSNILSQRVKEFQAYEKQAAILEATSKIRISANQPVNLVWYLRMKLLNNVDAAKDRQERTIFIFTMVTSVFLPLSAVSSIFGMNSSDIRDMEQGQWVYWITAVPLTMLIIVGGLWWLGELHGLTNWFMKLVGPKKGSGLPPVPRVDRKATIVPQTRRTMSPDSDRLIYRGGRRREAPWKVELERRRSFMRE